MPILVTLAPEFFKNGDTLSPILKALDGPTDPHGILETYILNKGKEAGGMPQTSISSEYARIYTRFADKNINIIAASAADSQVVLVAEYMFKRPKDDKLIWPKMAISSSTLLNALLQVEETIGFIRGEGE